MKSKYDLMKLGFALGIIAPILSLVVVYFVRFDGYTFPEFIQYLIKMKALSPIMSLMVIPNLLIFFIFIWLDHLYAARGVLAATVIDAVLIMVIKFAL
jgi:hypothetical protein